MDRQTREGGGGAAANPKFPRRRRGALSNDRDGNGTQLCKLMRLSECGHSLRFERGWRESELGRDEQTDGRTDESIKSVDPTSELRSREK